MGYRVGVVAFAAAVVGALGWIASAPADNPVLLGTVGPGFTISLTDASGLAVTHPDPGTYTVRVNDLGEIHDFHLFGPGVDQATSIEGTGMAEWTVTFTDGTYKFQCDPHATIMHGEFTVGNVSTTPAPTVHKLNASVGPGARIAFVGSAQAGKAAITVRDRSAADNFHLIGPGVNKRTSVHAKQTVTWNVTLKRATYTFRSDAHAKLHGKTRVS